MAARALPPLTSRDPLAAVPTTRRLWLAVVLAALVPTVDEASQTFGYFLPGVTLYGDCGYSDGPWCTPDMPLPGIVVPGSFDYVNHGILRAAVTLAVIALVVVAARIRTPATRRLARVATVLLAVGLAMGLSSHTPETVLLLAAALVLTVPPAWRRPPGPPRLPGPGLAPAASRRVH